MALRLTGKMPVLRSMAFFNGLFGSVSQILFVRGRRPPSVGRAPWARCARRRVAAQRASPGTILIRTPHRIHTPSSARKSSEGHPHPVGAVRERCPRHRRQTYPVVSCTGKYTPQLFLRQIYFVLFSGNMATTGPVACRPAASGTQPPRHEPELQPLPPPRVSQYREKPLHPAPTRVS